MPWNKSKDDAADTSSASKAGAENAAADNAATSKAGKVDKASNASVATSTDADSTTSYPKGYTPPKGRATPKRNDQERAAGVRKTKYEAPTTPGEARKRRKELKESMGREEYKAMKAREKEQKAAERKKVSDRMMAGDEAYLLDRDKGPERRFIRNYVDAHRYFMNYFVPAAFIVMIIMIIGTKLPLFANISSLVMLAIFVGMVLEGWLLGRRVNKLVSEKFPNTSLGKASIGFYAFTRATMIRKMRTPAPQVEIGEDVR